MIDPAGVPSIYPSLWVRRGHLIILTAKSEIVVRDHGLDAAETSRINQEACAVASRPEEPAPSGANSIGPKIVLTVIADGKTSTTSFVDAAAARSDPLVGDLVALIAKYFPGFDPLLRPANGE